ncbi:sugar transferase, partial [Campylobacter sp. 113]
MDPIKLASLQNQINTLKIQLSNAQANSAKARIQNQLSYKLGQAMIENS